MKTKKIYMTKKRKAKIFMWKTIVILMAISIGAGFIGHAGQKQAFNEPVKQSKVLTHRLPVNADKKILTVQDKIIISARKAGVDENKALAIAACESGFQPRIRNGQGSSATGIFQFIARTWFDYCEGDVKNADANISCFMKLYPKHPEWWECSQLIAKK